MSEKIGKTTEAVVQAAQAMITAMDGIWHEDMEDNYHLAPEYKNLKAALRGTEPGLMQLTELQLQRLKDVHVSIRACMDSIQRKTERAEESERNRVTITSAEAWSALNVMAFARALAESIEV